MRRDGVMRCDGVTRCDAKSALSGVTRLGDRDSQCCGGFRPGCAVPVYVLFGRITRDRGYVNDGLSGQWTLCKMKCNMLAVRMSQHICVVTTYNYIYAIL